MICEKHQVERNVKGRCGKCATEATDRVRQKHKVLLVKEAGGKCVKCGYDRCIRALTFHHRDPLEKLFDLSGKARTYSLERKRAEAKKCDLLCMNCHMEHEDNIRKL